MTVILIAECGLKSSFTYHVTNIWTGNHGEGTSSYTAYGREHTLFVADKVPIQGSSEPAFRGDPKLWNPEEMFVSAISACHMLWYLHICAVAGVRVLEYVDKAEGVLLVPRGEPGIFQEVTLNPEVVVAESAMIESANKLHEEAHKQCFISNSIKIPVQIRSAARVASIESFYA